ncbi:helicase-related protein [Ureibacillus terrenus]|uniref:helicase-related protein n=1 Tax=Ureibacillus terrenus TaxID=118246 RepID=UPI002E200F47|nr:helicase-related protein [Ureibacillus terrenus]
MTAKEVYKKLKEIVPDKKITFLSTHIPPIERLKRIGEIKKQKYQIVVSTQLVEAGVDIDFDIVYRDLAPLDSIQQAAGRCNRHGMRKGEIHVVHLTDGYKSFANYIYDGIRLNITQELLKNDAIPEERFFQFIEQYFEQLQAKTANKESLALLNGIQTLYFDGETTIGPFRFR